MAMLGLLLLALWADRHLPPQDLPWRPLSVAQPVGAFTRFKLNASGGEICRSTLMDAGFAPVAQPDRGLGPCRLHDTVRVGGARLDPAAPLMGCREALAYAVWERQVVQPAARRVLGSSVVRLHHYGTYACRLQRGSGISMISEHASANAIDIAAFDLADGRRIAVAKDWADAGEKGRFLREVRDGGCRVFDVALSPDFNAAHHDHLHLDMGPFRTCR